MAKPANLLTDVAGLKVGHAQDEHVATGVTVILAARPNVASGVVRGGAPGTRDVTLLEPEMTVESIDAIVLSGGSAFGLDAAGGVQALLRERGLGIAVGAAIVPIVPQAITFDLINGGDKNWGRRPLYWELGLAAAERAVAGTFSLGTVGAGYGATTANLKGGVGSASAKTSGGHTVSALAVVNAVGSTIVGDGPHFWAAPFERHAEYGGLGLPSMPGAGDLAMRIKAGGPPSTTIALVATDAILSKAEARRMAIMADDGLARAIRPAHAPMDGDTVFAVATQRVPMRPGSYDLTEIGMLAGDCLARAIARGVFEATALPFAGTRPAWRDLFGESG